MHPIERLRWVARAGDADASMLAAEGVQALGDLASEPRALVMAAVRLVGAHPDCGPLWWAASRLLVSSDPRAEARLIAEELADDETAEELAGTYPASTVLAGEAGVYVADSLVERIDVSAHLVGDPWDLQAAMRMLAGGGEVLGWTVDEASGALDGATLCCVEAQAAGPAGALVRRSGVALAAAARAAGVPVWLVAGVGRVLPAALFDAMARRAAMDSEGADLLDAGVFDACIGPDGAKAIREGLERGAGPVASELTR